MILDYLKNREMVSFSMPGHKGRGAEFFAIDVTELPDTDDLAHPTGMLKNMLCNLKHYFHSDTCYFLVNGSTCGILAAVYGTLNRGDQVLVDRNAHRSVFNGLAITGAEGIFIEGEFNEAYGINGAISPRAVEKALFTHPDVKGMILTSPNYFGICSDVERIAQILHEQGKFLIVDEAHGAHFYFCDQLPVGAMRLGADLSVCSLHKTMDSPNQTAVLNIKSKLIESDDILHSINMFQTSSPSYVLMSYGERACRNAWQNGQERWGKLIARCDKLKEQVESLGGYSILQNSDPTRIVIHTTRTSGQDLYDFLFHHKIAAEMAYLDNIVLIVTPSNIESDFELLLHALSEVPTSVWKNEFLDYCGKISKNTILSVLPPCNIIIREGEKITETALIRLKQNGIQFSKLFDN